MLEPIDYVFLVGIVLGLVEFVKSLGVTGNKLRWISLAVGIVMGGMFQGRELFPITKPYIDAFIYTIPVGLTACGLYSFVSARWQKTAEKEAFVVGDCDPNARG